MGLGFALIWSLSNKLSWIINYKDGFLSHITFFLSAGMAWVMVSYFDGEYMRTVYERIIALSVFGPFFFHWYGWGMYLVAILQNS